MTMRLSRAGIMRSPQAEERQAAASRMPTQRFFPRARIVT